MTAPTGPSSRELDAYHDKDLAYYSALVNAWVNTRMERDKSVLTISVGAAALLGTVATTAGISPGVQLTAFTVAFLGFALAAVGAVGAFHWNTHYLEREAKHKPGDAPVKTPRRLRAADLAMLVGILTGFFAATVLGLAMARAKSVAYAAPPTTSPPTASGSVQAGCCACCCAPRDSARSSARDSALRADPPRPRPDSAPRVRPRPSPRRRPARWAPGRNPTDTATQGAGRTAAAQPGVAVCSPVSPPPGDTGPTPTRP